MAKKRKKRPNDGSKFTLSTASFQHFVVETIEVPPGTPPRPRKDRPPYVPPTTDKEEAEGEEEQESPPQT